MAQSFDATLERVKTADGPSPEWPGYFVDLFDVTGASIATLGPLLGSETLAATDAVAARLDEVQFDLGEGPCWDAMRTAHPVAARDVRESYSRWPAFADAVSKDRVRSLVALPLRVGPLEIGAVDMYSAEESELDPVRTRQAGALAEAVGQQVLRAAIAGSAEAAESAAPNVFSRRVIHQATGMVLAQLDLAPADAVLVLRGHAFASGLPLIEVARQVVERTLDFSTLGPDQPRESSGKGDHDE